MNGDISIGTMAEAAGCKVQTVRYYEQIGLLPEPRRSRGNQRIYDESSVRRLRFIRHARELGFPIEAIRELISLSEWPDRSCEAVDAIARHQLAAVQIRIRQLDALRVELERMVENCSGGEVGDCNVIEILGDHSLCATNHEGASLAGPANPKG